MSLCIVTFFREIVLSLVPLPFHEKIFENEIHLFAITILSREKKFSMTNQFHGKKDKNLDCFNVLFLSRYKMEGNEASLQFTQLLEQVKRISELQNSGALEGVQDKERHLEHLQRQAEDIRNMLARLQVQPAPQSPTCQDVPPSEIYQNLGPLMGSGLRNSAAPALPPKSGKLSLF